MGSGVGGRLTTGEVKALEEKKIDWELNWDLIGAAMKEAGIPGDIAPLETESQFLARIITELHAKAVAASQQDESDESDADMVMKQCGDDRWGECDQYPRSNWEYEVDNGDTVAGYWDWVVSQAGGDEVDLETLTGVVGSAR